MTTATGTKKQAVKNLVGRPTKYSKALAEKICSRLSQGISLRTVCQDDDLPDAATVFRWLSIYKQFREQYARAKEESADAMAEEILDLSDGAIEVIRHGAEKKSSALAQAVKLQVDTRKWIMSKMKPKKYADKIDMELDIKSLPTPIYGGKSSKKV